MFLSQLFILLWFKTCSPRPLACSALRLCELHTMLCLMSCARAIDCVVQDGRTPLHCTIAYPDCTDDEAAIACANILLRADPGALSILCDCGWTALYHAATFGRDLFLRALLSHGARTDDSADQRGWSALHTAADKGYPECVGALIEAGADVNASSKARPPCRLALCQSFVCPAVMPESGPVLRTIERRIGPHGPPTRRAAQVGLSPLDFAVRAFTEPGERRAGAFGECIRLLVAAGADPNAENEVRFVSPGNIPGLLARCLLIVRSSERVGRNRRCVSFEFMNAHQ